MEQCRSGGIPGIPEIVILFIVEVTAVQRPLPLSQGVLETYPRVLHFRLRQEEPQLFILILVVDNGQVKVVIPAEGPRLEPRLRFLYQLVAS